MPSLADMIKKTATVNVPPKSAPGVPEGEAAAVRSLQTNIVQVNRAYRDWRTSKSNAQLDQLLLEVVESLNSIYVLMKSKHSGL